MKKKKCSVQKWPSGKRSHRTKHITQNHLIELRRIETRDLCEHRQGKLKIYWCTQYESWHVGATGEGC